MKKLLSTMVAALAVASFVSTASAIPANSNMGAAIKEIENPEKSPQTQETKPVQKPAPKHKKTTKTKKQTKKAKSNKEPAPAAQEQKQ